MTNETNDIATLHSWWGSVSFAGKEQYRLAENGELTLHAKPHRERVIATLNIDTADLTLKALTEKYAEVANRVQELKQEWDSTEDKMKLLGKVERLKEYLNHSNTAGDFETLYVQVTEWERHLKALEGENYNERLLLIQKAEQIADSNNWKETTQAYKDLTEMWRQAKYIDKHRSDELWNRFEVARTKFYERKRNHQDEQGKELMQNLDQKMELVEKAEALALSESWKDTTEIFKQLMDQWKTIGRSTTHDKNEELWQRFITAKNTFYDRKKIHFEHIQAQQEINLAAKLAIVEKAETLKESINWNETTQLLNGLMDEWKSSGRVSGERGDELWARFNAAKEFFYNNKQEYFEKRKVSFDDNYAQKMALLKRAESIKNSTRWREATDEMNELMDEWKKIGAVSREHANTLWEEFLAARKHFFNRKDADRDRRKEQFVKNQEGRVQESINFHKKLIDEVKEEQEKLDDFKVALENVTPGRKAEELQKHLQTLIAQTEERLKHRQEKLAEVEKQMQNLGANKSNPTA